MKVRLGLVLALFFECACVSQRPASSERSAVSVTPAARPGEATASPASAELKHAQTLAAASEWLEVDHVVRGLVDSDHFAQLTVTEQHVALGLAATAAVNTHEPQRGLSLIQRACAMTETDARDWFIRLAAANAAQNPKDAALTLTTLAERWPRELARAPDYGQIEWTMFRLGDLGSDFDRYELLRALHRVGFAREPNGASSWWRDFALLQLARGEPASAVQTLARINDPHVAISIWADKRFDVVRAELGDRLQVAAVAERGIQDALMRTQDSPNMLKPMNHLAALLVDSLRSQQALQVTDTAIERQEIPRGSVWSDSDRQYVWTLDTRARALYALGRWPAAITQLEAATRVKPSGGNVSQVINLAAAYNKLGQPREAQETLQRASLREASAYGIMLFQLHKFWSALLLHEEPDAKRALDFLREHRGDAPGAYQEALLIADRPDEGAAYLISRLADVRQRSAALEDVQYYAETPKPPLLLEQHLRWRALIDRPDVSQAIARVGRVDHYTSVMGGY